MGESMKHLLVNLGSLERLVLAYLWGRTRGATVKHMWIHLNLDTQEERKRTTYHATLERLVEKGLVTKTSLGTQGEYRPEHLYKAAHTREQLRALVLKDFDSI